MGRRYASRAHSRHGTSTPTNGRNRYIWGGHIGLNYQMGALVVGAEAKRSGRRQSLLQENSSIIVVAFLQTLGQKDTMRRCRYEDASWSKRASRRGANGFDVGIPPRRSIVAR